MKSLLGAYGMLMAAAMMPDNPYYAPEPSNTMNDYKPIQVTGFTEAQGRRHLSKKKRKELNQKKIRCVQKEMQLM